MSHLITREDITSWQKFPDRNCCDLPGNHEVYFLVMNTSNHIGPSRCQRCSLNFEVVEEGINISDFPPNMEGF